jgi:hypothetical protein
MVVVFDVMHFQSFIYHNFKLKIMGNIGIIGGGAGMRGFMLMSALFMSMAEHEIPKIVVPEKQKVPEKIPEYIILFGNGKNRFVFKTEYCEVEIWAGNPNSAQKKLRTVNGINSDIQRQRKYLGLS